MTKIEWVKGPNGERGKTWNPIVGCSLASPGCTNCYAMRMAYRLSKNPATPQYHGTAKLVNGKPVFTGKLELVEKALLEPLKRMTPTDYFVNSMGDLFHEDMPDEWIDEVFGVMAVSATRFHGKGDGYRKQFSPVAGQESEVIARWPNLKRGPHTFKVLTKRSERMRDYLSTRRKQIAAAAYRYAHNRTCAGGLADEIENGVMWPLPNVWLGVSVEDQKRWDERWPHLARTPAAIRFISAEPLLGPVDMTGAGKLDWVIVGGESGPNARPMELSWAESLKDQCASSGTAFFMKQMGGRRKPFPPIPEHLLIREFPNAT